MIFTLLRTRLRCLKARLKGYGKNNKIILIKNGKEREKYFWEKIPGLRIFILGSSNTIKLELPIKAVHSSIIIEHADNCLISIGSTSNFSNRHIACKFGSGQICKIGKGTTSTGANLWLSDAANLTIGENCMIGGGSIFMTTDWHTILDKNTEQILNRQKRPMIIGNHCWIMQNVIITKNAQIPNNTIVAANSVVTGVFTQEYTMLAGNPAKVVRENVVWDRRNIQEMELSMRRI